MTEILVVVAAGPGLGAAVARRFAREGASVGLLARSADRLAPLATELRSLGATVAVAEADVAGPAALRGALVSLRESLGDPSVLVFNGSQYVEGRPTEVDHDAFMHGLEVGIGAALVAAQAVAPAMRAAGRGTIMLTGSVAADRPSVAAATVGVAKAGLRNLALSLHRELEPEGVQAVTVTIRGVLSGAKALDLDEIAERYWSVHTRPREQWTAEVTHPG
jgi:NADP-dependent 3-hydroxy acid dehydrogenase YdfG